jgi:alkylhydroperoxidase family enzyme
MAEVWNFERSEMFTEAERSALRFSVAAAQSPNAVAPTHYDHLHKFYDDDAIVEMVGVLSYWAFLNRWNDTLATPLEENPLRYGQQNLSSRGWEPGRHA